MITFFCYIYYTLLINLKTYIFLYRNVWCLEKCYKNISVCIEFIMYLCSFYDN